MGNLQESTHDIKIAPPPATPPSPSMQDNKEAAPPPPNTILPIIALTLRALALGAQISLLVNLPATTATISVPAEDGQLNQFKNIKYSHFLAYRYMLACAAIGIVFTILLSYSSLFQLSYGYLPTKFAVYNEIMLIVLSSGGGASVGLTAELSRLPHEILNRIATAKFLDSIHSLTCIYLLAFLFNFVSSILTRLAA